MQPISTIVIYIGEEKSVECGITLLEKDVRKTKSMAIPIAMTSMVTALIVMMVMATMVPAVCADEYAGQYKTVLRQDNPMLNLTEEYNTKVIENTRDQHPGTQDKDRKIKRKYD